jgi:hypothetical protein
MIERAVNITRAAADELTVIRPFARTDRRSNFFAVQVCHAWNWLLKDIRAARTFV